MSSARETILAAVQRGRRTLAAPAYLLPPWSGDVAAVFSTNACASGCDVREIVAATEAPEAIWALLRAAQSEPRLHIPLGSPLADLPWARAPGLSISRGPPSGIDSALSRADYAVAETGTLVFLSGPQTPSSWHFRPGREIALVERSRIFPRLEHVFSDMRPKGMPATVNLVTGPSRTADIEQTIERGAHGPRAVDIFIIG